MQGTLFAYGAVCLGCLTTPAAKPLSMCMTAPPTCCLQGTLFAYGAVCLGCLWRR